MPHDPDLPNPLDSSTLTALLQSVRTIAKEEVLPRYQNQQSLQIEVKSDPNDLVTIADKITEARLTQGFKEIFPDALIIGEEAVFETPDLITQLDSAELAIVIDPIDGTWNYAHGLRHFGMIIAIVKNGKTIYGLLYDPLADDWIVGSKGQGVYYQKPDALSKPLDFKTEEGEEKGSKETRRLEKISGIIYSKGLSSAEASALTSTQEHITSREPLRCSCHEYRQLLLGEVDFVLTDHNPMPWDHLAGQFLVAEAGGRGGACHQHETGYPRLLSARTADIWRGINEVLEI